MTEVCSMPEVMEAMLIVNKVITILKILVPIVIIITGMVSFIKAILAPDDKAIRASVETLIVKIFVGAAIFFIPTIINSFAKIVAPNSNYTLCFAVNSKDDIYKTYASLAKKSISKARSSLSRSDYENASYYVNKMKDGAAKTEYQKSLEQINQNIKNNNKPSYTIDNSVIPGSNSSSSGSSNSGGSSSNGNNSSSIIQSSSASSAYGDIFIGDSRTVGYSYQLSLKSTDTIYATTGGSMKAFVSDFSKAYNKISSDSSHRYNLIFNYGVNNLSQDWVSIYKNAINQVGGKANILIVSVNPCNDSIAKYCKNSRITALNNKLRSAFSSGYTNVRYCDTYTPFVSTSNYTSMIETKSGVHYTKTGSTLIYNQIQQCLKSFK